MARDIWELWAADFVNPVPGVDVSTPFMKYNPDIWSLGYHTGSDFSAGYGTKVVAAWGGWVDQVTSGGPYGKIVRIRHHSAGQQPLYTFYAHLDTQTVRVGQTVSAGQQIGTVGSTGTNSSGPHLHFEVRTGDGSFKAGNFVDPTDLISGRAAGGDIEVRTDAATQPGSRSTSETAGAGGGGGATGTASGGDDVPEMSVEDYGYSKEFYKKYPGVKALADKAVKEGWTVTEFQTRLMDTKWWKSRTDAQRKYDTLAANDPKEAKAILSTVYQGLKRQSELLGVAVDEKKLREYAERVVRSGLDPEDAYRFFAVKVRYDSGLEGRAGIIQQRILEAASAYGVSITASRFSQMITEGLTQGDDWQEYIVGLEERFRERAKAKFGAVAEQIDRGATVDDILAPYKEQASRMLGVPAEQMGSWQGQWYEPISGDAVMTISDWQKHIRSDDRYKWQSGPEALGFAQRMANEIARTFNG